MNRIYLIGYMGSGKSTISSLLSKRLNWRQFDLDTIIESRSGYPIPQLFSLFGEDEFRNIERRSLHSVQHVSQCVIATGGGAPCFFDNISVMKASGTVLYLRGDAELLSQRISADEQNIRPILKGKGEKELLGFITNHLGQREEFYTKAHHIIDIDQKPSEIVETFISKLKN